MRYYIDSEFDGHNGPLLSIAMVREDGHSIHVTTDQVPTDPWVIENVVPILHYHEADVVHVDVELNRVGNRLRVFLSGDPHPTIVADSPVDIGRFCQVINTDKNGNWAPFHKARIDFEVHNVNCWPNDLEYLKQHNAWCDAVALRHVLLGDA